MPTGGFCSLNKEESRLQLWHCTWEAAAQEASESQEEGSSVVRADQFPVLAPSPGALGREARSQKWLLG